MEKRRLISLHPLIAGQPPRVCMVNLWGQVLLLPLWRLRNAPRPRLRNETIDESQRSGVIERDREGKKRRRRRIKGPYAA